ncbi:MAG: c-type cytochrome [Aestuariivirga sp.]|nr:c-type cytochrome [Aestuariivirga sp.]
MILVWVRKAILLLGLLAGLSSATAVRAETLEELGQSLFFDTNLSLNRTQSCAACHMPDQAFTDARGMAASGGNPAVADDAAQRGKFKTPTLRNVAVTGPYMHNGVFGDLRTVMLFYNKHNSKAARRQINPETGAAWAPPVAGDNLAREELEFGPALKDREVDALVAFLRTLTDKRYEHLLSD